MVQLGELVRTLQKNQPQYATGSSDINTMTQPYRNDHNLQVNFMTYNDNNQDYYSSLSKTKNVYDPIPAITRVISSTSRQTMKKTRVEWNGFGSSAATISAQTKNTKEFASE